MDQFNNIAINRTLEELCMAQLNGTVSDFTKSISTDIEKAKKANVGEIHVWNGKKYKKQANGKWLEVSVLHEMTKKEHEKMRDGVLGSKYFSNSEKEEMKEVTHRLSSDLSDKEHSDEEVGIGEKKDTSTKKPKHISDMDRQEKLEAAKDLGIENADKLSPKELDKQLIDKNIDRQLAVFKASSKK